MKAAVHPLVRTIRLGTWPGAWFSAWLGVWLGAMLLLAPLAATPAQAQDYDFPALTGRVVDEANLLDPVTRAGIETKLADIEARTTSQVVVVTLKSLRGRTIEEYGYQLGRHWGIGQKDSNNGVLLIVAPNERKVRIEVGYGLEGTFPDAIASVIVQGAILPRFRANDYRGGIERGVDDIVKVLSGNADEFKQRPSAPKGAALTIVSVLVSLLSSAPGLILLVILLHVFFHLFVRIGEWLGIIPKKARRKKSRWSWIDSAATGGYIGSGSGSGWSSGGGGGGFSGGGGSFGGGGSSGSW